MARQKKSPLVDEVVNQAVDRIRAIQEEQTGEASPETTERLSQAEAQSVEEEDIFDACAKLVERGTPVSYYLYHNGELKGVVPHPMSWEQLLKKGSGIWRVQAKNAATKTFIRQQTRTLGEQLFGQVEEEPVADPVSLAGFALPPHEPSQPSALDILQSLREMEKERDEKREARNKELLGTAASLLTAATPFILKFLEKKDDSSEKLITYMLEESRRAREESQRMIERLESKLSQPKAEQPAMNPFEFLKQLQEAEDRGFKRSKEFFEMVDEKAEAKAQTLIEKAGDDEPESLTDTLLKAFIPVVATGLQRGMVEGQAQPVELPAPQSHYPQPQAPTQEAVIPAQRVAKPAQTKVNVIPIKATPVGKPTQTPAAPTAATTQPQEAPAVQNSQQQPSLEQVRQGVINFLLPVVQKELMKYMIGGKPDAAKAASDSLKALATRGVKASQLIQLIPLDYLQNEVQKRGLPEIAKPWFNEYYGHLNSAAGTETRGTAGTPGEENPAGDRG